METENTHLKMSNYFTNFNRTEITQKISKNSLSREVFEYIKNGLQKAEEVRKYISHQAQIVPDFPESLTNGFKDKYNMLVAEKMEPDAIFKELWTFSTQESKDFLRTSAGLTVVAYLFERCEIFEQ